MPIARQLVDIPLVKGLQQLADDKLVQAPYLLEAKNVRMNKQGALVKRNGYEASGTVSSNVLAFLPDSQPACLCTDGSSFSYDANVQDIGDGWSSLVGSGAGEAPPAFIVDNRRLQLTNASQPGRSITSALYYNETTTYAFVAACIDTKVVFYALDCVTNEMVFGPQVIAYGRSPVITVFSGVVSLLYLRSTGPGGWNLYVSSASVSSAVQVGLGTSRAVASDNIGTTSGDGPFEFHATHDGTDWYVAAYHSSWSQGRISKFTDGLVGTPTATAATFTSTAVYDIFYDSVTSRLWLAYNNSGRKIAEVDTSALTLGSAVNCPTNTGSLLFASNPYDTDTTIVAIEVTDSLEIHTLDSTPSLTQESIIHGTRLVARPVADSLDEGGRLYLMVASTERGEGSVYDHATLACLYQQTADDPYSGCAPVSVYCVDRPFGAKAHVHYPSLAYDPNLGIFACPLGLFSPAVAPTNYGANAETNDLAEEYWIVTSTQGIRPVTAEFGELSYLSGGVLRSWDGRAVMPTHPCADPYYLDVTSGSSGTGHNFRVYYEGVDHKGVRHRSAVSDADERGSSDGSAGTLRGLGPHTWDRALSVTDDTGTFPNLYGVVAYDQGGTSNYFNAYHVTITETDSISNPITYSSNRVADHVFLYTSGGELPSNQPPASSFICAAKERLFLVPAEDRNQIWYSKLYAPGIAAEFNSVLRLLVDRTGGDITGLAALEDKIVIFKAGRILYTYGEGYDDTGGGGNFAPPQLITGEVGCINPHSIVTGSFGVMFESNKGIWQLDRGLNLVYVGMGVEDEHTSPINSAINLEESREVRFSQDNGNVLCYNHLYQLWTKFAGVNADVLGVYGGVAWKADGDDVGYESPTNWASDTNQHIQSRISTPWIRLNQLAGYQRIRRATLLLTGREASDDTAVKIYYDYDDSDADTISWTRAELSGFDGGDTFPLQIHIPRQKCNAIRIEFEDDADGSTQRDGYDILGLMLEVGIKQGLGKNLPAEQRK